MLWVTSQRSAADAPYAVGRRGRAWLKVKPAHTLDLVVLVAEWGYSRRTGTLSNIHLGARDPDDGPPLMVGKTFKGMTDALLTWQTEHFSARALRDGHVVHLPPEFVVEIELDGVQVSTRYPGGVALRFARVQRYRPDKTPLEADTIDAVRATARLAAVRPRSVHRNPRRGSCTGRTRGSGAGAWRRLPGRRAGRRPGAGRARRSQRSRRSGSAAVRR